jgi:hypothetical protein
MTRPQGQPDPPDDEWGRPDPPTGDEVIVAIAALLAIAAMLAALINL